MHFSQSRIYLSISIFIYLSLYIFISLYLFIYISIISIPICTMWNTPIMRTMWQKQSVKRFSLCNFHISFHGEGLYKLRVVCTFCHIHVRRKKLTNVWLIYAFLPPPPPRVWWSFYFVFILPYLQAAQSGSIHKRSLDWNQTETHLLGKGCCSSIIWTCIWCAKGPRASPWRHQLKGSLMEGNVKSCGSPLPPRADNADLIQ